jgi:hypothetical protein
MSRPNVLLWGSGSCAVETQPGAVVATGPASADANHNNGTVIQGADRRGRREVAATFRVEARVAWGCRDGTNFHPLRLGRRLRYHVVAVRLWCAAGHGLAAVGKRAGATGPKGSYPGRRRTRMCEYLGGEGTALAGFRWYGHLRADRTDRNTVRRSITPLTRIIHERLRKLPTERAISFVRDGPMPNAGKPSSSAPLLCRRS